MAILTARVQRLFHLFILSTTSEKSFIPYKVSAAVQALKVCPVRPRVLSSSAKSLVQLGNTFNKRIKRLKLINIENNLKTIVTCSVCLSSLCNKKNYSWGITLLEKLRAADES